MCAQSYMSGKPNKDITDALRKILADTFTLYMKTHGFHWNIEGPHFQSLHSLFEEQYNELWTATDDIAERIRSLGDYAPNSWSAMADLASLNECQQLPDADGMLQHLAEDNRKIVDVIYAGLRLAEEYGDEATVDMLIQRTQIHEKAAWMLESHLK